MLVETKIEDKKKTYLRPKECQQHSLGLIPFPSLPFPSPRHFSGWGGGCAGVLVIVSTI
jgi:hypothetical protein